MDREAELERICLYASAARNRIRRLDLLLEEQMQLLTADSSWAGLGVPRKANYGHLITFNEVRIFLAAFALLSLVAFVGGYWFGRWS